MSDTLSRNRKGIVIGIVTLVLVGAIGSILFARSHAEPVAPAPGGLLKPLSLGIAPYQYIAYSGSLAQTRQTTGVKNYFASFVTADNGCTPSWGGAASGRLDQARAQAIKADITALRISGGEAAISFGGADGTELALSCNTSGELAQAYQKVISMYGATRVDFDIEGTALTDQAATVRRAEAIAQLRRTNPGLHVWVTLPVHAQGLTDEGRFMLDSLVEKDVVLSGINIMAMNYNVRSQDMGSRATGAAQATVGQLSKLYPGEQEATLWKALSITVMAGHNNTPDEIFTLQNAGTVHDFAVKNGVGTLSLWNVARDTPCVDATTSQPNVACSGVPQKPYEFIKTLSIPARN